MKHAWDKKRVENHIATYGSPSSPNQRYKRRMIFASNQVVGNSVLDVACGVGHLYEPLKHRKIQYKGIDSSKEMIKSAKKYYPKGLFIVGDAYDLSKESLYDTVISTSLLIHIDLKDLPHVITQMWKHTKKALIFTIPVDTDFSKVVELNRKIPESSGTTLITHISEKTLQKIASNLKNGVLEKNSFPEGCFGYGLNDHLIKISKRSP